jgi:hypothetical protein
MGVVDPSAIGELGSDMSEYFALGELGPSTIGELGPSTIGELGTDMSEYSAIRELSPVTNAVVYTIRELGPSVIGELGPSAIGELGPVTIAVRSECSSMLVLATM